MSGGNRASMWEGREAEWRNPSSSAPMSDIVEQRLSRRDLLKGLAASTALGGLGTPIEAEAAGPSSLRFTEIPHSLDGRHHVARGYTARPLVRWGDPIVKGAPAFDPKNLTASGQEKQFGYNNDFLAYMPLPRGSNNSEHGLLCVNHEYTNVNLMFPGVRTRGDTARMTREQVDIDLAAHGLSVVEVKKTNGRWDWVRDSKYNRRYTTNGMAYRITGPAAGDKRMRTAADSSGTLALGTLNNCAGGTTPWGTVLSGEEGFNSNFSGDASKTSEAANHRRYDVRASRGDSWGRNYDRFNVEKEPNEPNRFGWVVEYDPYDPRSRPAKRTALGRIKHEGATTFVAPDGRVAVYTGDDERFEYLYRFVTAGRYNPRDRQANMDLLDEGVLSAARFNADGTMTWLPLIFGQGPLTAANGFNSQADVLIETRRAADLVGATPMDRTEDLEPNPVTGRVYAVLTYNERRGAADAPNARERANAANPRPKNPGGHIIEMIPPGGTGARADHTAEKYRWDFFIVAGDPRKPDEGTRYHSGTSADGWFARPDNIAFDRRGRIWISTDGMDNYAELADGLFAADTSGPGRALSRHFFATPRGAECTGPCFTPDCKTLFVAVQHPAEETGSTFDTPSTRWPDFVDGVPPRPSVVVITRNDGGEIGS